MDVPNYQARRTYDTTIAADGSAALRLSDRIVELGPETFHVYQRFVAWQPSKRAQSIEQALALDEAKARRALSALADSGVLVDVGAQPATVSGSVLRDRFAELLPTWLAQAFSHPFWERMTSGGGSARLFAGWLFELYHYTRNANRHMPLSCAHALEKPIKALRAKHYAEEWNHYHYFAKALRALGYTDQQISQSVPLQGTLAMSNFMRQAAREDILAYSICSAVLEGTTTDKSVYNDYHERCVELYALPRGAITPIYDHLGLDTQYNHSDLFADILAKVSELPTARAGRVLEYGHMMAEHIWMWTHDIERYYESYANPVPRRPVDLSLD